MAASTLPVYLRARYYDPATGQFISRDPAVAPTRQPYSYGYDNPLNVTDPSGICGASMWAMLWELCLVEKVASGGAVHSDAAAQVAAGAAAASGWGHDHFVLGFTACVLACVDLRVQGGRTAFSWGGPATGNVRA